MATITLEAGQKAAQDGEPAPGLLSDHPDGDDIPFGNRLGSKLKPLWVCCRPGHSSRRRGTKRERMDARTTTSGLPMEPRRQDARKSAAWRKSLLKR
jgi:hypothetical protein